MKRAGFGIVATAAFAAFLAGAATAYADVPEIFIDGSGYTGTAGDGNTGTDAFGNPWRWTKTTAGGFSPGAGFSVWGTPGLDFGNATYDDKVTDVPANDFQISFVGFGLSINQTLSPGTPADFTQYTRFESWNGSEFVAWTPVYDGTKTVTFYAPAGVTLTNGSEYFVNVLLNQKTWSGENAGFTAGFSAAVPEASTWVMLGLGFAAVGAAGASRRKVARYAI
jgi:hypothetical protein